MLLSDTEIAYRKQVFKILAQRNGCKGEGKGITKKYSNKITDYPNSKHRMHHAASVPSMQKTD